MSAPGAPRRPVSSGSGTPPPRRSRSGAPAPSTPDAPPVQSPQSAPPPRRRSTVVAPAETVAAPTTTSRRARREAAEKAPRATPTRERAPWWLRLVAWIVAVPVGLALVGIPARKLGYLDSQKLLDVLIGKDLGRYLPLVVIVVLWALVTAILVQVIVEGGNWLLRRRRARRTRAVA